jgi:hypothetical protein
MVSKKSIRKSQRLEAVANEAFKRFAAASWALDLASGDEDGLEAPAPEAQQKKLRDAFWATNAMTAQATIRVNLRNVSARFHRGRITRDEISVVIARVRQADEIR